MDLTDALNLARSGRSQAAAEFPEVEPPKRRHVPREKRERTDDEIVPKLTTGEWATWITDVARAMATRSGRDWYDLDADARERWRRLAELAVLAVEEAQIERTLARIRELSGPRVVPLTSDELREREAFAGLRGESAA